MLKDISSWNDIVDCFIKGDIWACGGLVMNLVPWGKIGKVIEAGYKAVKAVTSMANIILKAQGLLRRVEKITAQAQEIAMAAMRKLGDKGSTGCNSFMPGAKVLLSDGSSKPIEQVQNGDKVLATEERTGESSAQSVVATIIGDGAKNLVEITIDGGGAVTATDEHPFWLPDQKVWVGARELREGSILRTSSGERVRVAAVRVWSSVERVHNLTVDAVHTYHVLAGATPVLSHNIGESRVCDLTLGLGPNAREGVALPNGDKDAPGVQDLTNEAGDKYGCHTCAATVPGTKARPGRPQGNWITDHQGATKLVKDAQFNVYQTGYPHCWACARQQAGTVTQINRGNYEFEIEP